MKSCSELISYSYYHSFLTKKIGLATARAGNVVGGGDWSDNRIVTDIMNHYFNKKELIIRNINSIRPWQYVIDVTYGYLLAQKLYEKPKNLVLDGISPPQKKIKYQ